MSKEIKTVYTPKPGKGLESGWTNVNAPTVRVNTPPKPSSGGKGGASK